MSKALNNSTLSSFSNIAYKPTYDRTKLRGGIVHLSLGNFHRAHQALYIDKLLNLGNEEDLQWGITGIAVISNPFEKEKWAGMKKQDCLYTLTECPPDAEKSLKIVGSINNYIYLEHEYEKAIEALTSEDTKIVTMTVTEGGYNVNSEGKFILDAEFIQKDLKSEKKSTIFGLISLALKVRREKGLKPFTVLSCDNVRENGHIARGSICAYAEAYDAELAQWIKENVAFPSCMVDRITPATLPVDRERLNAFSGVDDEVPVFGEDFTQWVIEDNFCNGRPALEKVGVQFAKDVVPYELVKLRMLNAAHNLLSVTGLLIGYRFVDETMSDSSIYKNLQNYLFQDVAPIIVSPEGISLEEYGAMVLRRFSNPAIKDQLGRIITDCASKFQIFIKDTFIGLNQQNKDLKRVAFNIACFCKYLGGVDDKGVAFNVYEPTLSKEESELFQKGDVAEIAKHRTFDGWGLNGNQKAIDLIALYRDQLNSIGAKAALDGLVA